MNLACHRCDVHWATDTAETCWLCGGAGTPAHAFIAPLNGFDPNGFDPTRKESA